MLEIVLESASDADAIRSITKAAFADEPHSNQTEPAIIDALREANAIRLSLVARLEGRVVGNVVFSDVAIGAEDGWVGLGPVSVEPGLQRGGIGSALIQSGLEAMRQEGAKGCVLVGDPAYYHRFGFKPVPGLIYEGVPDEYVLALPFDTSEPTGTITYHAAFNAS
jgi:putative acetyltransferase